MTTASLSMIGRRTLLGGGAALFALPLHATGPSGTPAVRRLSPRLDAIVAPGAAPTVVTEGVQWAEGPVWVPREGGFLLFSDPPANIVRRWQPGRGTQVFLEPSGAADPDPDAIREPGANGLALDGKGRLLIANSGGRSIDRLDLATGRRSVVVDRFGGKRFNSPNDMVVARDGTIWFTDPPYGLAEGDDSPLKEQPHNGVYRLTPGGAAELMIADLTFPNGIALSPEERRLYVAVSDPAAPRVMAYDLDARGGVGAGRVLLDAGPMMGDDAPGLPDGMKVGRDGTLFCTVPGGLMVLTPEGEPLGLVTNGDGGPIANCAFGAGGRTLFMAANHRILSLPLARAMA